MAVFLAKETVSKELLETAQKLCKIKSLSNFNIVGGTALALQIGHRKSVDIDLFYNSLDGSADFAAIDNLPYFYDVSQEEFETLDFLENAPSLKDVCSVLSQEVKKYSEKIMGLT